MNCAVLALASLLALPASADDSLEPLADLLQGQQGNAGLGLVTRMEPSPYRDAGSRGDIVPLYLYEGERFFLHANRGGLKLINSGGHRVDVFAAQRLEGFPTDWHPASLAGMHMRSTGLDAGLSYHYTQPWGTVQADLQRDVTSTSSGSELRLGYSYDWRSGPWTLRPSLSLSWRDARLNNYYYGVRPSEATAERPAYAPGGGVNTSLGLYGTYDYSTHWRLLGGVSATVLNRQIADSPIVQKRVLPSVYVGAVYDFGGHEHEWAEPGSPISFKLLYGKATDDGCHLIKILTAQCLSTASVNPTSITSLQVGKLFEKNFNGWPVDLMGYVGLTHHDDHGLQANGLQLDLFMKLFYSGFSWSDRVKTRFGFGAGVSVARRAPYIEVSSQAILGRPTSHVLQYLEPTLDVSLGDVIGVRSLKETYIGLGVAHRSGIVGVSRMLGNVNGGSNYIYTYVEKAL